jgi:hypothetical protein
MNNTKVKKLQHELGGPQATFHKAHSTDVGYDLTCVGQAVGYIQNLELKLNLSRSLMTRKKQKEEPEVSVQPEVEVSEIEVNKKYIGSFPAQVTFNISAINKEKASEALNTCLTAMNIILKGSIQALTKPQISEV